MDDITAQARKRCDCPWCQGGATPGRSYSCVAAAWVTVLAAEKRDEATLEAIREGGNYKQCWEKLREWVKPYVDDGDPSLEVVSEAMDQIEGDGA